MFEYAFKNILRRWTRSLLTIGGVAVMMTLVIVITGIVEYQIRTMNAHAAAGSGKINIQPILAGTSYPAGGVDLAESEAESILRQTQDYIQPKLSTRIIYFTIQPPRYPNQPPELILTGVEPEHEEAFTGSIAQNVDPTEGVEHFSESDVTLPAILGQHAAEVYATETGNTIQIDSRIKILDREFTVIGILDRSADIVVNNAIIVPLDQAQELLDKHGYVSTVILTAADVNADRSILNVINTQFPRLNVITDDTVRRNAQDGIALFESMINTVSVVVVLCAAFLMMTVTLITVRERTKEIGVLRALGAPKRIVTGSLLCEMLMLSLIGSILGGIISAFILAFGLQENLFNLGHILACLPLAIVLTLLAGLVPAINISRIMPVEALRYE